MFKSIHSEFILTPLIDTVIEALNATKPIDDSINSYSISEYYFHSLFLKLSGAQEQKLKCIYWDLATNDYKYRYDLMNNKSYGECSSYDDKNGIYKDMINVIKRQEPNFNALDIWSTVELKSDTITQEHTLWTKREYGDRERRLKGNIKTQEDNGKFLTAEVKEKMRKKIVDAPLDETLFQQHILTVKRNKLISQTLDRIISLFGNTTISRWEERDYAFFRDYAHGLFKGIAFMNQKSGLMDSNLQRYYRTVVYEHRNRCAHNTTSYQKNLPTLAMLRDPKYPYQNYFYRIAFLLLLDEIYMGLYRKVITLDNI